MVYAPHWYDLYSLFNKSFGNLTVNVQGLSRGLFAPLAFYWGHASARDNFSLQIGNIAREAYVSLGERPVVLGECGIPFDMNEKEAMRTNNFKWQAMMMDAMITGLERSLLSFTLWNYNPDNTDEHGDSWCGENFSWFGNAHRRSQKLTTTLSVSQSDPTVKSLLEQDNKDLDDGGRILRAVVRPYPAKVAGVPVRWSYELNTGRVEFTWKEPKADEMRCRETEVFFPDTLLPDGKKIILEGLSDETWSYDRRQQTLFIVPPPSDFETTRTVVIRVEPPLEPLFEMTTHWKDFGKWYVLVISLLVAFLAFLIY